MMRRTQAMERPGKRIPGEERARWETLKHHGAGSECSKCSQEWAKGGQPQARWEREARPVHPLENPLKNFKQGSDMILTFSKHPFYYMASLYWRGMGITDRLSKGKPLELSRRVVTVFEWKDSPRDGDSGRISHLLLRQMDKTYLLTVEPNSLVRCN